MNSSTYIQKISQIDQKQIEATLALLNEGGTVPFIARYRKEKTKGLDEVQIAQIRDLHKQFDELIARQQTILKSIEEQGKLNEQLRERISSCFDSNMLEDLYLPFKQKRLTRGEKARKLGLEPLAKMIMAQRGGDPEYMSEKFIRGEINDVDEALAGANDIMAEFMNENSIIRDKLRRLFQRKSMLTSRILKGKREEGEKYKDYFDFSQPLYRVPSHRFLAIYRGEREGYLGLKVQPEKEEALSIMERFFVKGNDACSQMVLEACKDSYSRLLAPSLENETINLAKEKADLEAIQIFSKNLNQLLLAPPLGSKRVLAIDPGFRTGCKLVCLDEQGKLLNNQTIYPHPPQNEKSKASTKIQQLIEQYKIEALAIGDGTAGRETEQFIKQIRFRSDIEVYVVREDGASIYSASPIARKEFPDYDVTVRGAVSIGRRLMDPLAELVKIDPKSIGVGQYQHEVNQQHLKNALNDVVISAVNAVGVELNTASPSLLSYVSGLGESLAENIVNHRNEQGPFASRQDLKKVKRLGDKAFEQCAGFLRIKEAQNPLDNSAIHPERYQEIELMAQSLKMKIEDLIGNNKAIEQLKESDFPNIDTYTFKDLISELKKPGRDPRQKARSFEFRESVKTIEDLEIGMRLPGIVTNITAFGAFVNIGIKENGLIHKSQLADHYVNDPNEVLAIHEQVEVQVLEVDLPRKRIALKRLSD
ncbi:MAG: RNA-binding transcriptional accessory protein [Bacteroidetes bacterium]|nr:MAG: RNA-binding transcriptional accessory protein [Bacteroidota bacterium]